jgi:hypothetical protein
LGVAVIIGSLFRRMSVRPPGNDGADPQTLFALAVFPDALRRTFTPAHQSQLPS